MLLFFVEFVSDGFDEFLAGLLEVGLWLGFGSFLRRLQVHTHFESAEVGLEQGLVGGAEVLLHTGLGQTVCDTADESLVSGEGLQNCQLQR